MFGMVLSKACCKGDITIEVTGLRAARSIQANATSITDMVSAAVVPVSRAASVTQDLRFVQDEAGSHALAYDMICPRITGLGAELDDLGPVMERATILGSSGGLR
jgi:hypothetical protein